MLPIKTKTSFSGFIIKGEKVGRTINFPTANLKLAKTLDFLKPGVYVARVRLNKKAYLGLAYYGPRYIFGEKVNNFEVYIFNFNQNIYGQKLQANLTHFIRSPKKVKNLKALQSLLENDLHQLDNYVTLINRKDQPLGIEKKSLAHLKNGKLHRAISIQLFNSNGELLIQQRSKHKMLFPLIWANTVCTDVRPYETYLQAAHRRLLEEFGLTSKLKLHHHFLYQAKYKKVGSEKELDHFFIGLTNQTPKPNPQEITDYKFISLKHLKKDIKNYPKKYAPWFKLILKKLQRSDILTS